MLNGGSSTLAAGIAAVSILACITIPTGYVGDYSFSSIPKTQIVQYYTISADVVENYRTVAVSPMNKMLEFAEDIFGPMRSLTVEEQLDIKNHINRISKPVEANANFFDLC